MKKKALLAAALTLGSTGLSIFLGSPVAHAETRCPYFPDKNPVTYAEVRGQYNGYNLYLGNSTGCGTTGTTVSKGQMLHVICHLANNSNNDWYFTETAFQDRGWISKSNMQSVSVPACHS